MRIHSALCKLVAVVLLGLTPIAAAIAQTPAAPSPVPGSSVTLGRNDGYIMGPEDVIEVEVLGRNDFKVRSKISADGTVQLPFIGSVQAASKTPLQLADDVRGALDRGGFYRQPIMRVEVVNYASRYVTVLGAVSTPGLVPVDRPYRLSEIIARVGGVRENGADFVVLTPQKGEVRKLSIKALATGDPSLDPFVSPGDKIYSPQAEMFFISGQVKTPGSYPITENMTVRMAIARGGGLTEIGSEKRIKVTHPDGKVEKPTMQGKILPGDVVVVGERLF